jgi:mannose-6-phosphate isomerase-like protein (cupin superfamily)
MSLSFKPGEVETHDRETDIMQAVHGRAIVVTGEDRYILAVSDVLVIPGRVPQPVRGRHRPFLFLSATRYRPCSP